MNCRTVEEPDRLVLMLEGDLTIQNARQLRDAIMQARETGRHLALDLKKMTGADLSCLQLFCSAHHTLEKSDRRLTLLSPLLEAFERIVRQAGFSRKRGCILDVRHNCLWCSGGNP